MINSNLSGNQETLLELKKMNKLLILMATEGKSQGEKIIMLSQIGLSPKEIADSLNISANNVSVALYASKKKTKKPAKKKV